MTAAEEAKQLDSVTDIVQEKEMDESKAKDAMSALSTTVPSMLSDEKNAKIAVSKEDVDVIVSELEVTEETAIKALREVAANGQSPLLEAALRSLIVS
mmetsp:Transcript_17368/g.16838  ORF Transcript_17368/g.16838 Transcript_17368/m.16838 type:complete len:98 (+) Transcript_17368:136-429(+)|eukprot:CAMPEP_0197834536 /NCGR_PEP_ID=MMETSP1437-20131217/22710_1 /TAXON_ID=49252 ORGANISM="Eucampia antarctica, Strain CCMP1452" /NCGR_SAMPLE_ID=MMETSP1437 /ASSEMBLY_ACC=CAM_ASM_001096 /LENGTH=97 /DNA_ID=CAMNT_0043439277 /DNA_START=133 /DNA_END=426 /DNA_ORIENTATION=+